ncbi:unnamed protein product, partial [Rotaria magnacalcarata]
MLNEPMDELVNFHSYFHLPKGIGSISDGTTTDTG